MTASAIAEGNGAWLSLSRVSAWVVVCFLLLPIMVIVPISLTDRSYLSLPEAGLSLQYFVNLFTNPDWLSSFGQSFFVAVCAMVIAVLTGTLAAIGCWRVGGRVSDAMRALMLLPMIIPQVVYALGIYRLYAEMHLLGTFTGLIITHAVTGIPFVAILVSAALADFDMRLDQAARSLGASIFQSITLVLLPIIRPAIASGAIFAFIHSWDELLLVLFIGGRAIFTLPRRIWDGINDSLDPTMAAVATVLLFIACIMLVLDLVVRRRDL
jgi:putative spermidine/putrescine transport system permease protein